MATSRSAVRVVCESCGWRGTRVYATVGSLPYTHEDREGFGPCPRCAQRLAKWKSQYREKKDAIARAQFETQGA